jgi:hypothetical protein
MGAMDQVSRPALIALAVTIVLAAVWLVALRPSPKPVAIEKTPLGATKAIPLAKQAGAASDAANAKVQAATGNAPAAAAPSATPQDTATPGATSSAKTSGGSVTPSRAETKGERTVLREISQGKVVVMLFWSADSADDVATRGAVRGLNRHHGKVKVHVVPIGKVGQYGSITRDVKIAQSPTLLIIGKHGQTRTIVGLSEPKELGQAVGDAIAGR